MFYVVFLGDDSLCFRIFCEQVVVLVGGGLCFWKFCVEVSGFLVLVVMVVVVVVVVLVVLGGVLWLVVWWFVGFSVQWLYGGVVFGFMYGKIVLIMGVNSGLGCVMVVELLCLGVWVIMGCWDCVCVEEVVGQFCCEFFQVGDFRLGFDVGGVGEFIVKELDFVLLCLVCVFCQEMFQVWVLGSQQESRGWCGVLVGGMGVQRLGGVILGMIEMKSRNKWFLRWFESCRLEKLVGQFFFF